MIAASACGTQLSIAAIRFAVEESNRGGMAEKTHQVGARWQTRTAAVATGGDDPQDRWKRDSHSHVANLSGVVDSACELPHI
jgi:hypothetical protein